MEYVGFSTRGAVREYRLPLLLAGGDEPLHFPLIIPNEAFTSSSVRYQDAPEICFAKLQRELVHAPQACQERA